jgi:hypothetical protein
MLFEKQNYINVEFYFASQVIFWQWRNLFISNSKPPKMQTVYFISIYGVLPFKTEAIRILLTNNNVSCSSIRFVSCTDCVIAQVWARVKRSGGIVLYRRVALCN